MFGYKQTGKAAVQALNVFHPAVSGIVLCLNIMQAQHTVIYVYGELHGVVVSLE